MTDQCYWNPRSLLRHFRGQWAQQRESKDKVTANWGSKTWPWVQVPLALISFPFLGFSFSHWLNLYWFFSTSTCWGVLHGPKEMALPYRRLIPIKRQALLKEPVPFNHSTYSHPGPTINHRLIHSSTRLSICTPSFYGVPENGSKHLSLSRNQARPLPPWEKARYYHSRTTKCDVLELIRMMEKLKQCVFKMDNQQEPAV